MAEITSITLGNSLNDSILEDCNELLNTAETSLTALLGSTETFNIEHDKYILTAMKDSSVLKKEIKKKLAKIYNTKGIV